MNDVAVIDNIILVQMQRPGVDGTGITTAKEAQLTNDVAAAIARVNVTKLTDVPDVSGSGLAPGKALIRNAENTGWIAGDQIGSIGSIYDHTDTKIASNATSITAKKGLTARAGTGPNAVVFEARLGSSGTSEVLTREDHTHAIRLPVNVPIPVSGSFSSGSRPLVSQNITGFDPARTYNVWAELRGDAQGEGTGAGYSLPSVTLTAASANTKSRFGNVRSVAGVPREYGMTHSGITFTGRSSITVAASLQFQPGDPINVGAGELVIVIESDR